MIYSPVCIVDPMQGNSTSRIMGFLSSISNFCSESKLSLIITEGVKAFNLTVEENCTIDNKRAEQLAKTTSLCSWSAHDKGMTFSGACSKLQSSLNDTIIKNIEEQCPPTFNWLSLFICIGIIGGALFIPLTFYGVRYIKNQLHKNVNNRLNEYDIEKGNGNTDEGIPLIVRR